jgi:hypothetical protein
VSGSKSKTSVAVKALVLFGGGWVIIITLWAASIQFNLGAVAQGQMPFIMALRLGIDSLPALVFLFILGLVSMWLVLRKNKNTILTSLVCILFGGTLLYGVYLARFSIGIFLLPPAITILMGGLLSVGMDSR